MFPIQWPFAFKKYLQKAGNGKIAFPYSIDNGIIDSLHYLFTEIIWPPGPGLYPDKSISIQLFFPV